MEEVKLRFVKHFVYLQIITLCIYTILFGLGDLVFAIKIVGIPLLLFSFLGYFFSNYPFNFDLVYRLGLYGFGFYVYCVILLFRFEPIAYASCIVIVLAVNVACSMKETVIWAVVFLVLSFTAGNVADFLNIPRTFPMPEGQVVLNRYTALLIGVVFSLFFLYYNKMFAQAKMLATLNKEKETKSNVGVGNVEEQVIDEGDFVTLFKSIETYLRVGQAYKSPQFSIELMANKLASNTTYISKAIKLNTGMNFKTLINDYRIREIKERIQAGDHTRFTLKHLYTEVGFANQSTFNRVFKEVEGITPSQFIDKINY